MESERDGDGESEGGLEREFLRGIVLKYMLLGMASGNWKAERRKSEKERRI